MNILALNSIFEMTTGILVGLIILVVIVLAVVAYLRSQIEGTYHLFRPGTPDTKVAVITIQENQVAGIKQMRIVSTDGTSNLVYVLGDFKVTGWDVFNTASEKQSGVPVGGLSVNFFTGDLTLTVPRYSGFPLQKPADAPSAGLIDKLKSLTGGPTTHTFSLRETDPSHVVPLCGGSGTVSKVNSATYTAVSGSCTSSNVPGMSTVLMGKKGSVNLDSLNGTWGSDPCPGIEKRMDVSYECSA